MSRTVRIELTVDQWRTLLCHTLPDPSYDDLEIVYATMSDIIADKCQRIQARAEYAERIRDKQSP